MTDNQRRREAVERLSSLGFDSNGAITPPRRDVLEVACGTTSLTDEERVADLIDLLSEDDGLSHKLASVTSAYANTLEELDALKAEVEARERRLTSLGNQPVQGDESFGDGDPVTAPAHYAGDGDTSCMDAMRSMACGYDAPAIVSYWCLSALKYLWRWTGKGGVQDLEKARRCIDYAIGECGR